MSDIGRLALRGPKPQNAAEPANDGRTARPDGGRAFEDILDRVVRVAKPHATRAPSGTTRRGEAGGFDDRATGAAGNRESRSSEARVVRPTAEVQATRARHHANAAARDRTGRAVPEERSREAEVATGRPVEGARGENAPIRENDASPITPMGDPAEALPDTVDAVSGPAVPEQTPSAVGARQDFSSPVRSAQGTERSAQGHDVSWPTGRSSRGVVRDAELAIAAGDGNETAARRTGRVSAAGNDRAPVNAAAFKNTEAASRQVPLPTGGTILRTETHLTPPRRYVPTYAEITMNEGHPPGGRGAFSPPDGGSITPSLPPQSGHHGDSRRGDASPEQVADPSRVTARQAEADPQGIDLPTGDPAAPAGGWPPPGLQSLADSIASLAAGVSGDLRPHRPAHPADDSESVTRSATPVRALTVRLDVPDFGAVTVRLRLGGDALSLRISTETEEAGDRLRHHREALSRYLHDLGCEVDVTMVAARSDHTVAAPGGDQPAAAPAARSPDLHSASPDGRETPRGPNADREKHAHSNHTDEIDGLEKQTADRRHGDLYV